MPLGRPFERLEPRRLMAAVVLREEVTDFGESEVADDVESQRDDQILVLGHIENASDGGQIYLAQYDVDGSLNTFFGEDGRVFGDFENFRRATSMAIDRSGRMIVAGVTSDADPAIAVMRFTRSGVLDRSFGNNGLATLQAGTGEVVNDVAVDSSGRVTVVGQASLTTGSTTVPGFLVARFESFGQADTSFGGGEDFALGAGFTVFPVGIGESGATSVVLDGSRIFVGGFGTEQETSQPPERRFAIAKLEKSGVIDEDFGDGDDGIVVLDFGLPSMVQDIARARDGKLVVAGNTLPTLDVPGEQVLVARLDRGGQLDPAFAGGDGFTFSAFGGARSQMTSEIVVDKNDRVLLAGEIRDTGEPTGDLDDDQFFLARYLSDGTLDDTFASGGALINEVEQGLGSVERVAGLSLQRDGRDGRAVVAGNTGTSNTDQDIAVVRVATDATEKTGSARLKGRSLLVRGSDRDDIITVSPNFASATIQVNVNGAVQLFPASAVSRIGIVAKDGDDEVTCSVGGDIVTTIEGNDDDDDLRLLGDARGRLEGDDGDDDLTGGDRADRLRGGDGDDLIFGGAGDDDITGDDGFDTLFGEDGDDDLKADDGFHDDINGGDGDDDARIDFFDFVTRVDDIELV